jgi:hypothetical protein
MPVITSEDATKIQVDKIGSLSEHLKALVDIEGFEVEVSYYFPMKCD